MNKVLQEAECWKCGKKFEYLYRKIRRKYCTQDCYQTRMKEKRIEEKYFKRNNAITMGRVILIILSYAAIFYGALYATIELMRYLL